MQAAHSHTLKPKTRRDSAPAFRLHIYQTFGNRRIDTITTMDIEQWRADWRTAVSREVRATLLAVEHPHWLRLAVLVSRHAVQLWLITADPCVPVRIPEVDHHKLTFLTPEQVAALVDYLDVTAPDGLIVQVAAYTGLRAGELDGLRIGDVNLFARQPFVRVQRQAQFTAGVGWEYITPKSNKPIRNVPLRPALLEQHPSPSNPDAPLWPGRRHSGHGKTRGALDYTIQSNHGNMYRKHFLPALAALGIPAVRWHDLRHFYASARAAAAITIERVAKHMGHANIATIYKHYLHLFADSHTDDMERLAAVATRPVLRAVAQIGG